MKKLSKISIFLSIFLFSLTSCKNFLDSTSLKDLESAIDYINSPEVEIYIEANNEFGTINMPDNAKSYSRVMLDIVPIEDYEVDEVFVFDENGELITEFVNIEPIFSDKYQGKKYFIKNKIIKLK